MDLIKKEINVYTSEDGKEFLTEKECVDYENNILTKLENIKYFKYCTNRDLTETGMFFSHNYAAVYIDGYDSCYEEVLMQYLLDKHNGNLLSVNVQGYGVTSNFSISEITKDEYFAKIPNKWGGRNTTAEQIFLSEINIEGYPENIKVISRKINLK
jgi:hypothetical protein